MPERQPSQCDEQRVLIELERFAARVADEENRSMPLKNIVDVQQFLGVVTGHFRRRRVDPVKVKEHAERQHRDQRERGPAQAQRYAGARLTPPRADRIAPLGERFLRLPERGEKASHAGKPRGDADRRELVLDHIVDGERTVRVECECQRRADKTCKNERGTPRGKSPRRGACRRRGGRVALRRHPQREHDRRGVQQQRDRD